MCGIFAYAGSHSAPELLLNGLQRLEYRGYDSWGFAVMHDGIISVQKAVGPIGSMNNLSLPQRATVGIAHTRWATHGAVTRVNAHPHFSTSESFVVAQNGIVENDWPLKTRLMRKKYPFVTETDTEVIVRLIEDELTGTHNIQTAIRNAFLKLEGRNTVIVLTRDGKIIAARNGSPLVIGKNTKTGDVFLSSDALSFAQMADSLLVVENGQMVSVTPGSEIAVRSIATDRILPHTFTKLDIKNSHIDTEGYPHFMIKEIHEAPYVIRQLTRQPAKKYHELAHAVNKAQHVYAIASGTAGIAAAQTAFYLRTFSGINATALVGADAREYYPLITKKDIVIAPSQSGETADVLEVLEVLKKKGAPIVSFVNMPGSLMSRMSDYPFMSEAGPEVCVMATKVFVSQIAWGYLIAKSAAGKYDEGITQLTRLSGMVQKMLSNPSWHKRIESIARMLVPVKDIFLLGKQQNFNIAKEGMVKLIEGSYKHAHAIPAGDLKHYAITLMEKNVPVIAVVSNDDTRTEVMNAVHQVHARSAHVIGIGPYDDNLFDAYIRVPDTGETSAIANIIPLQLLAYYLTVLLGNNVDHPRNIAKSVTVK